MEIHFAPMQGLTDQAFRKTHSKLYGGVDYYYTPFLRVERGDFRKKDVKELPTDEPKTITQIIATENIKHIKMMADLIRESGLRRANVNMGCPFPMIVRKGMGTGMMPKEDKVREMLEAMREYEDIEWSLKLRLGLESEVEAQRLLPMINDFPFANVTLHPRVAKQLYAGELNHEAFKAFAAECKHPLIYNGEICTTEDIENIKALHTSISGIMIGRGLIKNPALAEEYAKGERMTAKEHKERLRKMMEALLASAEERMTGREQTLTHMHEYWEYLYPETEKRLRKKIIKARDTNLYKMAVTEFIAEMEL